RRYYVDLGRRSAFDIVRRWAPAECGDAATSFIAGLAVRGIGGTLRARWLASPAARGRVVQLTADAPEGQGRAAGAPAPRVSVVIPRALPTIRVPDIAVDTGAPPPKPVAAAARPAQKPVTAAPKPDAVAATSASGAAKLACVPDEQRLRNYAGAIGASV